MIGALICVDPVRINDVWPHVEPLLAPAMNAALADDDIASVKSDLDQGCALLWIVWDESIRAAATTKILNVPNKRICVVTSCGGRDVLKWYGFIAALEEHARAEGCDAMRVTGRRGWKRLLKDYSEPWVCLEKGLK